MAKTNTSKTTRKTTKPSVNSGSSTKSDMKTSEIRDLIDFISKTGLNEVNIETKELKLHVKREPDQKILKSSAAVASGPVQTYTAPQQISNATPKAEKIEVESAGSKLVEIKSPMIGTFYRSPNPDSPSFVNVGDKVTKGQIICIIEAMKLFNEIESEVSGKIVKVLVDNSSPVEYDQPLFLVDPS
jgi:acetyl-CoA carboxylase biotin carboxyl carrier protein